MIKEKYDSLDTIRVIRWQDNLFLLSQNFNQKFHIYTQNRYIFTRLSKKKEKKKDTYLLIKHHSEEKKDKIFYIKENIYTNRS